MQVEIENKNCFGLKGKLPFVIARFPINLHSLWCMERDSNVSYFSDAAAMGRQMATKNFFGLKSKLPFVTDRFRPNKQ
jgi:hypothetical protein